MIAHSTLFLMLLFSVNFAFAIPKEVPKVDGFCKQLAPQIAQGSISESKVKSMVADNFGEEILNDSKKIEQLKTVISKIKTDQYAPDDLFDLCRTLIVKEFTNGAGRFFFGQGKPAEEPSLTDEDHKNRVDDTQGSEEILHTNFVTVEDKPIESLCRMSEIPSCESSENEQIHVLLNVVEYQMPNPQPYSGPDCDCYDKKTNLNKAQTISKGQSTWDEIDHLIIKEAGKKFINDYAKFYEDLRFYEDNRGWALKDNGQREKDPIDSNVLCVDPQIFMKAISKTCSENGTTNVQESRTSELLSSLGGHFNGSQKEFSNSFKELVRDIEINPVNLANNGEPRTVEVSRRDFEKSRVHNVRVMPDISVVDEMIEIVIKDKDLKNQLNAAMNDKLPVSPLEAMKRMFSSKGLDASTIKKVLGKVTKNNKNKILINKLLENLGKESFDLKSSEMFRTAVAYHPGLKNILLDKKLFNEVSASITKNDKGVLWKAERHKNLLSFFNDRCTGLKEQLAEAVCTKTSDLKSKVDKNEMLPLLSKSNLLNQSDANSQNAFNLAICSMKEGTKSIPSAFTGLAAKGPFASSDYKRRKDPAFGSTQKDMFSKYAERIATDKSFLESQRKIVQDESYLNSSSGQIDNQMKFFPSQVTSTTVGDHGLFTNKSNATSFARSDALPSADKINGSVDKVQPNTDVANPSEQIPAQSPSLGSLANVPASSFAAIPQAVVRTPESKDSLSKIEEMNPLREELRNSFPKSDQKKVESLMRNLNEEDTKELLRLREQSKKDKSEISDLKLEQERNKTLELQAKYEALAKKLDDLTNSKTTSEGQPPSFSSNDSGKDYKPQGLGNMSDKSNFTDFQATSGSTSGSSAQSTGTQASGASVKESSSGGSNATSNQGVESKSQIKLMISSRAPIGQNKIEDPSQELIAFLSKNEPDFKTLNDLKVSGMIFNYVVQENGVPVSKSKVIKYSELSENAKKLVDQKILRFDTKEAIKLKEQVLISRRAYSIQALKLELLSSDRSLNK